MHQALGEAREEFFKGCELRACAPGSYFWAGEHAVMYGQLAVIHAIPLYAYVGIEYKSYEKFEFEVKGVRKDVSTGLEDLTAEQVEPITQWYEESRVEKFLEFWRKKNKQDYLKIKIWFEVPPKCGLNSSGAIAVALSGLLQILETKKEKRQTLMGKINGWRNKSIEELKEDTIFNMVFRKAWILDDCSHNFSSSGMGPFSSLVGSPNGDLLLYFTQKKGFGSTHLINRLNKNDIELRPEDFEQVAKKSRKIDWWAKRLPLKKKMKESLGVAVIYCGTPKDTGDILGQLEKIYSVPIEDLIASFTDIFPEKTFKRFTDLARPMSDFTKQYHEPPLDSEFYAKSLFNESLGLLSWMLVQRIKLDNLHELADHVKTINRFLDFYGVFRGKLVELYEAIKEINGDVGVKLTGAGGGGDLLVLGDRDSIEGIENNIKKEYQVHFSTNRMGWEAEALTIVKGPPEKIAIAPPERDIVEIGLRDNERYMLINQSPSPLRLSEGFFAPLVLLLAARKKGRKLNKIENLLSPPVYPRREQRISDVRKFLKLYLETVPHKMQVEEGRILHADGKGNICLEIFEDEGIIIDPSICKFESQHMQRAERELKQVLRTLKVAEEQRSDPWDSPPFKPAFDDFKDQASLTFRHTRMVMKAAQIMEWEFQDGNAEWWQRWQDLVSKTRELLKRVRYPKNRIAEEFYLPQRGHH